MTDAPEPPVRPAVRALALSACATLYFGLRVLSFGTIYETDNGLPYFTGSDSYAHAHRIRLLFERFPFPVFHDRYIFHPEGTTLEWPLGFDWPIAAALRLFAAFGAPWDKLQWLLPAVPVVISFGGLAAFWIAARSYFAERQALLATLCFSASIAAARVTSLGELDHHGNETTGVALCLALPVLVERKRSHAVAAAIALAWVAWSTTMFAMLLIGFVWIWAIAIVHARRRPRHFDAFAGALLVALGAPCVFESMSRGAWLEMTTLSCLHLLAIAVPIAAVVAIDRLPIAASIGLLLVPALGGAIALSTGFGWIVRFVGGSDAVFASVGETLPIFLDAGGPTTTYVHAYFGLAFIAFPLVILVARRQANLAGSIPSVIIWFASVLFVLAFAQKRMAHAFVPAFVLLTIAVAPALWRKRNVALGIAALMLLEPVLVANAHLSAMVSPSTRDSVALALEIRAIGVTPGMGVQAPPNAGNAINYIARAPVVTNTFFYPRYLQRDLELRSFERDEDLVAFLRRTKIALLVAADDVRYRTILLRLFHRADAEASAEDDFEPCGRAHRRFAYYRLACGGDAIPGLTKIATTVVNRSSAALIRQRTIFRVEP